VDDLSLGQIRKFEEELYRFVDNSQQPLLAEIREKKSLDDALRTKIDAMLKEFKQRFLAEHSA